MSKSKRPKKAAKKKAAKKAAKKGKMPARRRPPEVKNVGPEWGPPVILGSIGDNPVEIPTPMNQAAVQALSPLAGVALVLNQRLSEMEEQIKLMQRDLDLHNRLSRLEAAAAED